jgi:ribosomal protein S18 acetylase RimI-like enzyme
MMEISIQSFTPADIEDVDELQREYARIVPEVKIVPAGIYLSPAFHKGQDVFCAFSDGKLIAYAPAYVQVNTGPANLPHRVWVEIRVHPALLNPTPVRDQLLDYLMRRARMLLGEVDPGEDLRPAQMVFEYSTTETDAMNYVSARGFACSESVFSMRRDLMELSLPSPKLDAAGFTLKRWKMETEAEQLAYIAARNECFPESPIRLEEWQYFMHSPMWPAATMIATFDHDQLVGCVNVYWNAEENQQKGVQAGFTEDIFVRPAWRGRGIAYAMIADGLFYLKEHGMNEAHLAVRALNQNALGLYHQLGFQVSSESRFYVRDL